MKWKIVFWTLTTLKKPPLKFILSCGIKNLKLNKKTFSLKIYFCLISEIFKEMHSNAILIKQRRNKKEEKLDSFPR